MTETTMPVAEATSELTTEEVTSYELAFHVLPTVAEGEVATVLAEIKQLITNAGGTLGVEETPKRFDLAYEVTKHLEGKHRRFTSAYFGWVRFAAPAAAVADLMSEVESRPDILRALLVKLTKAEEAHPFYFHEALQADQKAVAEAEATDEADESAEAEAETDTNTESESVEDSDTTETDKAASA